MKKILLVLLAAVCCAPAYAAQDEALNFYQRQALMRGDGSRADRAFASALARETKLWAAQHPQNDELKTALLMQADYNLIKIKRNPTFMERLKQVRKFAAAL